MFRLFVIGLTGLLLSSMAAAATPTSAQIEQFKKLPKAQQQALAKQYGVDLDSLESQQRQTPSEDERPQALIDSRDVQAELATKRAADSSKEIVSESAEQLEPFGYSLFAGTPNTFAPLGYAPVPGSYMLGAGDTIKINLYGKETASYELEVNSEGDIEIPTLGVFNAVGLTYAELKKYIHDIVEQRMIGVRANITMGKLRSIQVFVLGAAYKPGAYTVSSLSTITHALVISGGVSEIGSLRNIQLKRAGKLVSELDIYDLLLKGDTSKDQLLRSGDVVFIPTRANSVSIDGDVRRPAIYEFKSGESVSELLGFAGGMLPNAYPQQARMERFDDRRLRAIENIDLSDPAALASLLKQGDFLHVPSTSERYSEAITLRGNIVRPGSYQLRKGMHISDLIKNREAYLKENTDLEYGLLVREINQRGRVRA